MEKKLAFFKGGYYYYQTHSVNHIQQTHPKQKKRVVFLVS